MAMWIPGRLFGEKGIGQGGWRGGTRGILGRGGVLTWEPFGNGAGQKSEEPAARAVTVAPRHTETPRASPWRRWTWLVTAMGTLAPRPRAYSRAAASAWRRAKSTASSSSGKDRVSVAPNTVKPAAPSESYLGCTSTAAVAAICPTTAPRALATW